jgi:hypothetical protein
MAEVSEWAFSGVTNLECVTLVDCQLNQAVVKAVTPALATNAKVVNPVLAGQNFGRLAQAAAP